MHFSAQNKIDDTECVNSRTTFNLDDVKRLGKNIKLLLQYLCFTAH